MDLIDYLTGYSALIALGRRSVCSIGDLLYLLGVTDFIHEDFSAFWTLSILKIFSFNRAEESGIILFSRSSDASFDLSAMFHSDISWDTLHRQEVLWMHLCTGESSQRPLTNVWSIRARLQVSVLIQGDGIMGYADWWTSEHSVFRINLRKLCMHIIQRCCFFLLFVFFWQEPEVCGIVVNHQLSSDRRCVGGLNRYTRIKKVSKIQ